MLSKAITDPELQYNRKVNVSTLSFLAGYSTRLCKQDQLISNKINKLLKINLYYIHDQTWFSTYFNLFGNKNS